MKLYFTSILCTILCLLFLSGCSDPAESTAPATETPQTESQVTDTPTEAPTPGLIKQGRPWDPEGILTEIPLTIPEAWKYTGIVGFGDSLLFYGYDTHLSESRLMNLLLLDPGTGNVQGATTLSIANYASPQIFNDHIYLSDSDSGMVYELDGNLSTTNQWKITPQEGFWYMGGNNILYQFNGNKLYALDPVTGESRLITSEDTSVYASHFASTTVQMGYHNPNTNLYTPAILDLNTGTILEPSIEGNLSTVNYQQGVWLCTPASNGYSYYLDNGQSRQRITIKGGSLDLLPEGYLLESTSEPSQLTLYSMDGNFLSTCYLSDNVYYYLKSTPVLNKTGEGYFLLVEGFEGDMHLLFWDLSQTVSGSDLTTEPLLEPSEALAQLRKRADTLEAEYGVSILMGEACRTEFDDFRGEITTDWEEISMELDSMEIALSSYPDGFFRQLKFGSVQGIQIYLIQNLEATVGERVGGSYNAFATQESDRYTLVFDILATNEYTYYHEFSHVIDQYLTWNVLEREELLYSEAQWEALNPAGFQYVYSYVDDFYWYDYSYHGKWFIDTYSTTFPSEDRARIMEYAMMSDNSCYFLEGTGLYEKLDYYCRCIRDAFDTTGWPEVTVWEQYLNP